LRHRSRGSPTLRRRDCDDLRVPNDCLSDSFWIGRSNTRGPSTRTSRGRLPIESNAIRGDRSMRILTWYDKKGKLDAITVKHDSKMKKKGKECRIA
jgi:hypothetical protein